MLAPVSCSKWDCKLDKSQLFLKNVLLKNTPINGNNNNNDNNRRHNHINKIIISGLGTANQR